jgi:hypothetical protein
MVLRRVANVEFSYTEPRAENVAYLAALFDMSRWQHAKGSQIFDEKASPLYLARKAARERLARCLAASEIDVDGNITVLRKFCPMGCHRSPEDAIASLQSDLKLVLLPAPPNIPACNRWMKLFPCECFWMAALKLNIVTEEINCIASREIDALPNLPPEESDLVADNSSETQYKRKHLLQNKKLRAWIQRPHLARNLSVECVLQLPLFANLGKYLTKGAFEHDSDNSMRDFCSSSRSPAIQTFRQYSELLSSPGDLKWSARAYRLH